MEFGSTFLSNLFTPSSLFVLLNLVIGTIFLTARLGAQRTQLSDSPGQLARARSSFGSINLSLHSPDDPARLSRQPSFLDRLRSLGSGKSDPEPEREQILNTTKLADKREDNDGETTEEKRRPETARVTEKETAIERVGNGDPVVRADRLEITTAVERWRLKTARAMTENETAPSRGVREECVNAKADDFINRFRQQLRLQRLASLERLSELIKGK